MTDASSRGGRAGRGPGSVYAGAAVLLFVALSALSLTPANPTPPAIAEFAPQPREQIKDAPAEQSSDFGSGEGGDVGEGVAASPTPSAQASATPAASESAAPDKARVRRCVGNPPRQTEDPQSPPCVAYWDGAGGNGGATTKGVTADTITIAVPWVSSGPGQGETELTREVEALEAFFNARFEFYGRKLDLVKFAGDDDSDVGTPDPARQTADAVKADDELRAFASLPYAEDGGADFYYYDELARRGIISVYSALGTSRSEAQLAAKHPYQWGVLPPASRMSDNLGEWTCKNLKDRPATWGGADVNGKPRKYAILTSPSPDGTKPPIAPLRKRLSDCGIAVTEVEVPYADNQAGARTAMLRMKNEGVTTILPWTAASALFLAIYPAAENAAYTPEWVITSNLNQDEDTAGLLAPSNQTQHSFGLRFQNKSQNVADLPANWAVKEADPGADNISLANEKYVYQPLMVLASGIQAAGPNLTPKTFGDALSNLQFPNPAHGAAPWYQAHVGFQGDHTWFDDATPVWWRAGETSRQTAQATGAYCYVDRGRRYDLGEWRLSPLFGSGPCY